VSREGAEPAPVDVPLRVGLPDVVTGPEGTLERWRPGDKAVLHDLVARSVEHLREYMTFARDEPVTLAARREFLDAWDASWRANTIGPYQLRDDEGAACGVISLNRGPVPQEISIGYWIAPWEEGRGRVTRAASLLTAEALAHDEVDTVVITHDAANTRSAAVPSRLGFRRKRAESRDPSHGGHSFVTVRWEADRTWRPPARFGTTPR
jgi:RimJ/RimL family protein N-acetyltransferase